VRSGSARSGRRSIAITKTSDVRDAVADEPSVLASVRVQSRWGNLHEAPATVRSLAVDLSRRAQVVADLAIPAAGPVADRLPGRALRLRVRDLPTPPGRGQCQILLGLGELTDLVTGRVTMIPQHHPDRAELRVLISAAVPGAVPG